MLIFIVFYFAAKKELGTSTAGLLERRNVLVETPSSIFDHPNGIGNGNGGAVPLSPNTRRMAFNFTPISPRLTPDIPPSPGSAGQPLHLRQLLSTQGGGTSPLVAPGQTSAPSSFPPSQPHLGHNSGHFVITNNELLFFLKRDSINYFFTEIIILDDEHGHPGFIRHRVHQRQK
jgi:hypothetical protein